MDEATKQTGREATEREDQQRAEWERRPVRPIAWLRCKLTHAHRSEEWETDDSNPDLTESWLIGAWCGECGRLLQRGRRHG